jgi:chorismate--pyruvate lyase
MGWTTRNPFRGKVRAWVGATGSLSARLAAAGQGFGVQLLAHGRQALSLDEARALGLSGVQAAYVREVVLHVNGVQVVFARSVTPYAASRGPWRAIRGLGLRPLADVLFARQSVTRSPLVFSALKTSGPLRRQVGHRWQRTGSGALPFGTLPARRSVFTQGGVPLLVMEVFASPQAPWNWAVSRRVSGPKQVPVR